MKTISWLTLAIAFILIGKAVAAAPPDQVDIHLVEIEAQRQTGMSAIELKDLVSIEDPTSAGRLSYICGTIVLGGTERPLLALLGDDPLTKDRKLGTLKIAKTDRDARVAQQLCREQAEFKASVERGGSGLAQALQDYSTADMFCQAAGGEYCEAREGARASLIEKGWCLTNGKWRECER